MNSFAFKKNQDLLSKNKQEFYQTSNHTILCVNAHFALDYLEFNLTAVSFSPDPTELGDHLVCVVLP